MKCPFCGYENITGADECDSCGEDLTAFDGVRPKDLLEKGLVRDPILSVAKCKTWTAPETASILECAKKMDHGNNCCLIVRGDQLIGIATERDILMKALLKDFDLAKTPITKIMTPNPDILNSQDKIVHALNKMAIGGYRHIPIRLDDGSYQVISGRDILAYLATRFSDVAGIRG
jgi:CBS domain-containing protein